MEELDFTATARDEIYDPAIAQSCFEALGKPHSVEEGKCFFEHNQASDRMYLLLDGQVRLVRGGKTLDIINPGEIFGEIAVITGHPRTASAVAKGACRVLSLDAEQFEQAIQKTPQFALMLMGILINRLRLSVAILDRTGSLPDRSAKEASIVFDKALIGDSCQDFKMTNRHFIVRIHQRHYGRIEDSFVLGYSSVAEDVSPFRV